MKSKTIIRTQQAPAPIGPYSQAVRAGSLLFVSGQLGFDPSSGAFVSDRVEDQTKQALTNMKAIVEEAGAQMSDVIKTVIFLKDMNDFPKVNEMYGTFFAVEPPARSTIEVARLPKDARVEIECIVAMKNV